MKLETNHFEATPQLSDMFRLLSDPNRLHLVLLCLGERRNVSDLADTLTLSQSLVSHHLRLLRAARLLKAEREGKHVFYTLDDIHVAQMLEAMLSHVAECEDIISL